MTDPAELIGALRQERDTVAKGRARVAFGVAATVTVVWALGVTITGQVDRVLFQWPAAVMMLFGSFVAGSTPQGGGAVAFPVLTKVIGSPPEVARTMALSIQTFGMGMATITALILHRAVDWRSYRWTMVGAIPGFLAVIVWASDWSRPFAPSLLDATWTRILFTVAVVSMGISVAQRARSPLNVFVLAVPDHRRARIIIGAGGLAGGCLSALTGSGADLIMFALCSLLFGLEPRRAVASSVMVMATLSLIGFAWFGLVNGQLMIALNGEQVAAVDSQAVTLDGDAVVFASSVGVDGSTVEGAAVPATRYDLLGMVLAALPVVVWGAPLGAAFAARARPAVLAAFIATLAAVEYVSTLVLVPEIWKNPAMAGAVLGGVVIAVVVLRRAARNEELRRSREGGHRFGRATVDTTPSRLRRLERK